MSIHEKKQEIIAIVGPTASGKSDLAVEMARHINKKREQYGVRGAEIISADSRQVYKNMDIGTGKITKREMRGIPHHMLSIISPKKIFTVSDYQKKATKVMRELSKKNIVPIVCGGTGFYIDTLIYGKEIPNVPPNKPLRKKLSKKTTEELFTILKNMDTKRAQTIDGKNPVRLIRAIEIATALGTVPQLKENKCIKNVLFLGISPKKEVLYKKIHVRLMKRMRAGMVREVENLHENGVSWKRLEQFGLEYRFVSRFLRGLMSRKEMIQNLEKEIILYTKRQTTWFRRNKNIQWIKDKNDALRIVNIFYTKS